MYTILDGNKSQFTINYLNKNNINIDDIEVIRNYINETKRLVNNLKVYYFEEKRANKYKLIPNFLLNRRLEEKIDLEEDKISFINKEVCKELNDLREMKTYLNDWRIVKKLEKCSNETTSDESTLIPMDIFHRDLLIIKDYINHTNGFIDKNEFNLESIAIQTFWDRLLDISKSNIKKQEDNYINNYDEIKNNVDFVRDIYFKAYNTLIKSTSSEETDPTISNYLLKSDVKKIKKQYKLKKNKTLVDNYVESTYSDISKMHKAKTTIF